MAVSCDMLQLETAADGRVRDTRHRRSSDLTDRPRPTALVRGAGDFTERPRPTALVRGAGDFTERPRLTSRVRGAGHLPIATTVVAPATALADLDAVHPDRLPAVSCGPRLARARATARARVGAAAGAPPRRCPQVFAAQPAPEWLRNPAWRRVNTAAMLA
ncbi:hypothetical protein VSS74_20410 [Conexibacter stalactiti]|uniref:Uncharacterized protein n=1 Tax=Conexibacter stalactiti TaxID=1940611 RepID=A0ABU4HTU6_9ACTN|nr:hypothetical protein [Conexibacter stalactiti]MDW5596723.1 hypothetical protein [Conexibacter stalactiti]MEC5037365.1 hypothetical protein [Conexibacter stalactiti]